MNICLINRSPIYRSRFLGYFANKLRFSDSLDKRFGTSLLGGAVVDILNRLNMLTGEHVVYQRCVSSQSVAARRPRKS